MVQRDIITLISSENLDNELNYWIYKHPHVIQSSNVSNSIFFKIDGTIVKKNKHLPQILVHDIHTNLILLVYQGGFYGTINEGGKVCIGDTYLRKYMPKYIKPMSNINKITCRYETCISAMLLKFDLIKWHLTPLEKLGILYINSTSTRI